MKLLSRPSSSLPRLLMDAGLIALTLALGIGASWLLSAALMHQEDLQERERLSASGQAVLDSFAGELTNAVAAVRGAALMIAMRPDLQHTEFVNFGDALLAQTSSLRFLEWQPRVLHAERAAFEKRMAQVYPGFRIRDPLEGVLAAAAVRPEYLPILYAAPEQASEIGLDVAFDPSRLRSKLLARDSGVPMASEPFDIIEAPDQPNSIDGLQGFAISAPVYHSATIPPVEQRGRLLRGYVAGVIRTGTLLREAAQRADAARLDLLVFDRAGGAGKLMFSLRGEDSDLTGSARNYQAGPEDLQFALDVAGRPWEVVLHPRPGYAVQRAFSTSRMAGIGGLLATLLLAAAVLRLQRTRRRLELTQQETKQTERALAVQRQNLTHILDGTDAGTWEWDIRSGQLTVNERWAGILGYTLEELAPVTLERWNGLIHPDDSAHAKLLLRRHFSGELPFYVIDLRMRHKDGRWVWVSTRGRVFETTADKRAARMAGTQLDIDERKRADFALHESESRYEDLTNRIPVGVFVSRLRADGRISFEYASGQFCRMCDVTVAGALSNAANVFNAIHPDDFSEFIRALLAAGRSLAPLAWEGRFVVHGEIRWMRIESAGSSAGNGDSIWNGVLSDISQRKQAELALTENERFLRLVTEVFPGMVSHWNAELRCTFANGAYLEWYGLGPEQVIGMEIRALLGEEPYKVSRPHIVAALNGEIQRFEKEHIKPDGSRAQTLAHYIPDRVGEEGRGFFAINTDITQVKQSQQALEHLNRQLKARTAEAEAASQAKGRFLANMSHELRTPMNAILGLLQLVQRTEVTPRQRDYLQKTDIAARSLLGILNDILDYSKVEAGKMQLERESFRLEPLMRELAVIMAEGVGKKDVELVFDLDPDLPESLVGDALRLKQVLVNLAGNAVKFTADGEVVVSVRVAQADAQRVHLRFDVADTGIGISEQNRQHIFESFSQAESSTTRRFGGTGLGLAFSQRMVRLQGGELELESSPGQGSRFWFTLPFSRGPATLLPPEPAAPLRVLVVDDHEGARRSVAAMADALGWQAEAVWSGEQAVMLLEESRGFPFDVVLVDWSMPGMDGWQAAQEIRRRRDAAQSNAKVVMMLSGSGRESLELHLQDSAHAQDPYLLKPFTAAILRDAVCGTAPAPEAMRGMAGEARLQGMSLLVAEDNPINQQVVSELLRLEGAIVTLAADGEACVAAIENAARPFDAVLMDVQMPVMDGYQATAEIRGRLGLAKLPVIAMTANAMPADRSACIAAGMNEHVGKPFDIDQLVITLLAQCGRTIRQVPALRAPALTPAVAPEDEPVLDIAGTMQRLRADTDFYARMAAIYLRDSQLQLERLPAALESAPAEAAQVMHTLKGMAATIGARRLMLAAAAAETACRASDQPQPALLEPVRAAHEAAAEELRQWLATVQTAADERPAAQGSRGELRTDLNELRALLAAANMRSVDRYYALARRHGQVLAEFGATARTLDDAMARLDFAQGLACTQNLLHHLEQ